VGEGAGQRGDEAGDEEDETARGGAHGLR
jgi:hypothetical protein